MKQNRWKQWGITAVLIAGTAGMLWAQKQKAPVKDDRKGQAYLSDKATATGNISVDNFHKLISEPVWVKDSAGNFYPVQTFTYTYAERGMFEDETGKEFISTDYLSSHCKDKLDKGMANDMQYRAKAGDTAYIEQVMYLLPNKEGKQAAVQAQGIKLILTK